MRPNDLMPPEPEIDRYEEWTLYRYEMLTEVWLHNKWHIFSIPTLSLEQAPHLLTHFYEAFSAGYGRGFKAGEHHVQSNFKRIMGI
jgi:hypothetical protein